MNKKLKDLSADRLACIRMEGNDFDSVVEVMSAPYTIKDQWFIKIEPGIGEVVIKVKLEELKLFSKKEEKEWQDALATFHRNNPKGLTCCDNCCKDSKKKITNCN